MHGGGGGTCVPYVHCFVDLNDDRTITVSYVYFGPA